MILASLVGCASLTPDGAKVKVYEADLRTPAEARRLPQGCRLVGSTAPFDQMESERHTDDPYRVQRNDTAAKGGNVLLVLSDRYLTRSKTDCAPSDTSVDCQNRAQNWYKTQTESYTCDAAALQALDSLEPSKTGVASWWPFDKKKPAPAASEAPPAAAAAASPASAPVAPGLKASELKSKILVLMHEGVGSDVLVAYAKSNRLNAPLTAEEIVDWKKSGIADSVIEAVLSSFASAP
jgi:hypothetical protein